MDWFSGALVVLLLILVTFLVSHLRKPDPPLFINSAPYIGVGSFTSHTLVVDLQFQDFVGKFTTWVFGQKAGATAIERVIHDFASGTLTVPLDLAMNQKHLLFQHEPKLLMHAHAYVSAFLLFDRDGNQLIVNMDPSTQFLVKGIQIIAWSHESPNVK